MSTWQRASAFHFAPPFVQPRGRLPPSLASCQRRVLGVAGMAAGAASADGPRAALLGTRRAPSAAEHKRLFVAVELAEDDKAALNRTVDALKAGIVPLPYFPVRRVHATKTRV